VPDSIVPARSHGLVSSAHTYRRDGSKKTKWNRTEEAGEIPLLERPVVYFSDPSANVKAGHPSRRTKLYLSARINGKTRHVSGIYQSVENPRFGYGDLRGTNHLLLFRFTEDSQAVEVFLSEGRKHLADVLLFRLMEGQLEVDIEECRRAKCDNNKVAEVALSATGHAQHETGLFP
jgi:hypothetical protein